MDIKYQTRYQSQKSTTNLPLKVEAEMSQKLSWRDLFVQIELGVDIASLAIK